MKGGDADCTEVSARTELRLGSIVRAGDTVKVSCARKLNKNDQRGGEYRSDWAARPNGGFCSIIQRRLPLQARVPLIRIAIELQVQADCALFEHTMIVNGSHHLNQAKSASNTRNGPLRGLPGDELQQARSVLKRLGLRGTAARLAVVSHMLDASGPESHAEVAAALRAQGFDSATIYRNLIELTKAGTLSRVDLGDHVWRFERMRAARKSNGSHPHFVCDDCGSVSCLEADYIRISRKATGTGVRQVSSITVKGRCRSC